MNVFRDKTVLITGGASGIGRALSEELGRRGARVTVADIDTARLERTAGSLRAAGHTASAAVLDVTDAVAFRELVDSVVAENGRLDYLFNNAGIVVVGEAQDFSFEDWHRVIDVNLYGVVHGVMSAYPVMVKQGRGHIVNTASAAGLFPSAGEISYTASKYGVVGLSNALRVEASSYGVRVSVVCPGFIRTPIYENARLLGVDRDFFVGIQPHMLSAKRCARVVLKRVERNRAVIPVGLDAWTVWLMQRLSPGLTDLITRNQIERVRRYASK